MKNLLITVFLLSGVLILSQNATADRDNQPTQKSYFKYQSSQTLKPGSIWNSIITTKIGKVTKKSYFQYPDSKTLPQGSIWNPMIVTGLQNIFRNILIHPKKPSMPVEDWR